MRPLPIHALDATGTRDSSTFLSGDGTWKAPSGGSGGSSVQAAAKVVRMATLSLPAGSVTFIPFDTQDIDTADFWDVGAPTRLTVPAGLGGTYLVSGNLAYNHPGGGAGTERNLLLYRNGAIHTETGGPIDSSGWGSASFSTLMSLAASDYLEVAFYQNSGGTSSLRANSTRRSTWLNVARVAD